MRATAKAIFPSGREPSALEDPVVESERRSPLVYVQTVLVVSLLGISHSARADDDDQESSEDDSAYIESIMFEEVLPAKPGEWDIRASLEADRSTSEEGTRSTVFMAPRGQLFFGIIDRLGGELDVPLMLRVEKPRAVGLGDVGAGLKYLVVKQRGLFPNLTGMFEAHVPTGDQNRRLGEGKTELEPSIGWASVLPTLTVQGAIGYSVTLPAPEHRLIYDLSLAFSLLEGFHLFGEFLGQTGLPEPRTGLSAGPGVKYNVTPEFFLAGGVVVGLTRAADRYRAALQVQYGL